MPSIDASINRYRIKKERKKERKSSIRESDSRVGFNKKEGKKKVKIR
jgi:hypothetical protein